MAKYGILLTSDRHHIVAMKTTVASPADSDWDNQDNAIVLQSYGCESPIKSMWAFEDSSDIHVVTQQESGRVAYHVFDPGTDAWTTADEEVVYPGPTNFEAPPTTPGVSIAVRGDGDVIVAAAYDDATPDKRIAVIVRTSGVWSSPSVFDDATAAVDYTNPVLIGPDSSDGITCVHTNVDDSDVEMSFISSTDVITAAGTDVDDAADTATLLVGPGVMDGNTIWVAYIDASNDISTRDWTSAASPSFNDINADVSDSTVLGHGNPATTISHTSGSGSINFGRVATNNTKTAQSFTPDQTVSKILASFRLQKSGSPTDNVLLHIETDNLNEPSGTQIGEQITFISGTLLSVSGAEFIRTIQTTLSANTKYWFVFNRSGSLNDTDYYQNVRVSTSGASGSFAEFDGSSWTVQASNDMAHVLTFLPFDPVACLSIGDVSSDISLLYVEDTDFDLQHDDDATVAGGGTETELEAGSISAISARKGTSDINYFFNDAGTTKFGAHAFAAPAGPSPGRLMLLGVGT